LALEGNRRMAEDSREGTTSSGKDDFARFAGNSIPEHYDRGLGPVLFAEFGDHIARRAASYQPGRALETAAGTGIVTRLLRDLLPAGATLTATDLNAPMMEIAKAKFRAEEQVEFRAADAGDLPFPDRSFDIAVCQFGVMFFVDKAKSYREARRVLSQGGRYLFNVFDSLAFNPCPRVVAELLASAFKIDPPPFLQVPYGYSSIDSIVASLHDAGFRDVRVDVVNLMRRVDDLPAFAAAFVLGSPLADQIRARGMEPLELVARVESALRERALKDGRAPLRAIMFDAAAP
jgi:SAM-dependent methyltransferase